MLKRILEKLVCCHEWTVYNVYGNKYVAVCHKCGKFKQLE